MELNNHGGDLYKITKLYDLKEKDILDFSANINPLGIPDSLKECIISNIDNLVNYPDPYCNDLREHLSLYLSIPKEFIITGNGASELIYILFDVLKPKTVLLPAPCFSEYIKAANISNTEIIYYKLKEANNFKLVMKDFLVSVPDGIELIFLCNPNNPTSTMVSKEDMLELITYAKKMNINVVVDETFIELTVGGNQNSISEYVKSFDNLYIIRALTKILAIPGLRLGYALGNERLINKIWDKKIPWSVNTFACSLGRLLTNNQDYFNRTAEWLKIEKAWLYNEISKFEDLKVFRPATNFILAKIKNEQIKASALKEMLILRGILIRDASNFEFLDDQFFRIAVKDWESNKKLIHELADVFKNKL